MFSVEISRSIGLRLACSANHSRRVASSRQGSNLFIACAALLDLRQGGGHRSVIGAGVITGMVMIAVLFPIAGPGIVSSLLR